MLKYFFAILIAGLALVLALAGFRGSLSSKPPIEIFPDMDHQPKFQPQHQNKFFSDHSSARKPVAGTVPLGYTMPGAYSSNDASNSKSADQKGFSKGTDYYNTGRMNGFYGDGLPAELNEVFLSRGQERYGIHCAVCHGATGQGNGIVTNYGLNGVANLLQERFRTMPDGQIFNTITHGKNTMGAYGSNIAVEDRWAIVAYIRALQRSQNAQLADVPENKRAEMEKVEVVKQ